jgi:hypothetical protein
MNMALANFIGKHVEIGVAYIAVYIGISRLFSYERHKPHARLAVKGPVLQIYETSFLQYSLLSNKAPVFPCSSAYIHR